MNILGLDGQKLVPHSLIQIWSAGVKGPKKIFMVAVTSKTVAAPSIARKIVDGAVTVLR